MLTCEHQHYLQFRKCFLYFCDLKWQSCFNYKWASSYHFSLLYVNVFHITSSQTNSAKSSSFEAKIQDFHTLNKALKSGPLSCYKYYLVSFEFYPSMAYILRINSKLRGTTVNILFDTIKWADLCTNDALPKQVLNHFVSQACKQILCKVYQRKTGTVCVRHPTFLYWKLEKCSSDTSLFS